MRSGAAITAVVLGLGLVGVLALRSRDAGREDLAGPASPAPPRESPSYVGRAACVECHAAEHERWTGSHHDLAMQPATAETVLGDFDDAVLDHQGLATRFFRDAGRFMVETQGADGAQGSYEVSYTFGVEPLQQYLVGFPDGRYQVLSASWDTRPAGEGGQRWFDIHPDEAVPPGDPLHWTGPQQTWNFMCAACHSTGLRKGYDLAADRYETTWEEVDVSCEACHGPASRHLAWAAGEPADDLGLAVRLTDAGEGGWAFAAGEPTAHRTAPRAADPLPACARCHALASPIREPQEPARPLLDTHRLRLLDEGLYHADGQILEEVYEVGSFLQSRMARAGVVCSDCHDPHALDVYVDGNALCARCHAADVFDAPPHHFHEPRTPGAACVDCHMPATTYMVVDPRRDHGFRVPRPDLSVRLGVPNACNGCHGDRSAAWAAEAVERRHGRERPPHFGEALHAGRQGAPGAREALVALVEDAGQPAIARATALSLLGDLAGPASLGAIDLGLGDDDALVRAAAVGALEGRPPEALRPRAAAVLDDPVRLVRVEAARVLAPLPAASLPAGFGAAAAELIDSELAAADRPEAHMNLGNFHLDRGDPAAAVAAYRTALRLAPAFVPAWVNLAEAQRVLGGEQACEAVLAEGLAVAPDDGDLRHALGLLRVREGRMPEAIGELEAAARLRPDLARYAYALALALHAAGRTEEAVGVLEEAVVRRPHDPDLLLGLATLWRDLGATDRALDWARQLQAVAPDDPRARSLVEALR